MPLQQELISPHGASSNYWRITGLQIDALRGYALITLSGYVGQAQAEGGAQALDTRTFNFEGPAFQAVAGAEPPAGAATMLQAIAMVAYAQIMQPLAKDTDDREGEFASATVLA